MHYLKSLFCVCLLWVHTTQAALSSSADFNDREDGGAAVYNDRRSLPSADGALVTGALAKGLPLYQQGRIYVLGGGVRGLGMVAELEPDDYGQIRVVVARETDLSSRGQEPYTPIAVVRLIDPDGNLAAFAELTDQSEAVATVELTVPNAQAGIWRISFSGGRRGDLVEFRLPATDIWGVRGEMSLGTTESTPGVSGRAYLWSPPSAELLMIGVDQGRATGAELNDLKGKTLATLEADPVRYPGRVIPRPTPKSEVLELVLPEGFGGVLTIEGVPGLLCPTPEAALHLKGGMLEVEGQWVNGPLQARARALAIEIAENLDLNPSFDYPTEIPEGLTNLSYHSLVYGKYGPLNNLTNMIREQNAYLDPSRVDFAWDRSGSPPEPVDPAHPEVGFRPTPGPVGFGPMQYAGAVTFESPLNPAWHRQELIERSALGAMANIAKLQGDDLLRDGSLVKGVYPMAATFLLYPFSLTAPYYELEPLLEGELNEVWREGVMAVGDKHADFQSFQSNQWVHMMLGHLEVYMATGEPRFLGYFERQARAFFTGAFGAGAKFGQHPAGYYLEEFGPDGNYDKMNSFGVAAIYAHYRELPAANPELVRLIRESMELNIRFNSFFWLPQPDGNIRGPSALNARKNHYIGGSVFPGMLMPKAEFPLAASRFAMAEAPERGIGLAGQYPFIANKEEWIRETLEYSLKKGADGYNGTGGSWIPYIAKWYAMPKVVEPGILPIEEEKTWDLPGMLVWNRNGLYGMSFYDVAGTTKGNLTSLTGGGPSVLWTRQSGNILSSMQPGAYPSYKAQTKPEEMTYGAIYGKTADGKFFHSGKERADIEQLGEHVYVITSELKSPAGQIQWKYDYSGEGLLLGVRFQSNQPVSECFVNLPLNTRLDDSAVNLSGENQAYFDANGARVEFQWSGGKPGQILSSVNNEILRLVVPIEADGQWLEFNIKPLSFKDVSF